MTLDKDEIEFLRNAIGGSDPFNSVEEARKTVERGQQMLNSVTESLKASQSILDDMIERDGFIIRLQEKLGMSKKDVS